jgi:hypothetical protein
VLMVRIYHPNHTSACRIIVKLEDRLVVQWVTEVEEEYSMGREVDGEVGEEV